MLIWELWKRRNSIRHSKEMTSAALVYKIMMTLHQVISIVFPLWKNLPRYWVDSLDLLQDCWPKLYYKIVKWEESGLGWIKCNTNRACKGNTGPATYRFCIRDQNQNLVYTEPWHIREANSLIAEASAIWNTLGYCRTQGFQNVILETNSFSQYEIIR